jgi:hypothetical protein
MNRGKLERAVGGMNDLNDNCLGSEKLRAKATAFTRRRALGATRLLRMIIMRVYTLDDEIAAADQGKELKYPRRANRNRAISKLRRDFLRLMVETNEELRKMMLDKIISDITQYPLPVVRNRLMPPRKTPRKKRFPVAKKSVVL